jgi:hypothetical protein
MKLQMKRKLTYSHYIHNNQDIYTIHAHKAIKLKIHYSIIVVVYTVKTL